MTQEEKARAYDEALEKARKELGICGSLDCDAARQIFRFFPQLSESEDERIREWLVYYFKAIGKSWLHHRDISIEQILAYLEKQKEPHKRLRDKTPWIVTAKEELAHDEERLQANLEELHRIRAEKEKQKEQKVEIGSKIVAPVGQAICIDPELINPEPKPIQKWRGQEWSDEDQKSLNRAINICISDFGEECETSRFLKSLPERFNLQPKQEWSEEENQLIGFIFDLLNDLVWRKDWAMSKEECLERLKSLRPSWKPSEEQIKYLLMLADYFESEGGISNAKTLREFHEQLRKL